MFSKQQISKQKQEFWTIFGRYMQPIPSAEGIKINWVNYKTGIKSIRVKMDAGKDKAFAGMVIMPGNSKPDIWNQVIAMKPLFTQVAGGNWNWEEAVLNENGEIENRIYQELADVNILHKQDWPRLISFFKTSIIQMDAFWCQAKEILA